MADLPGDAQHKLNTLDIMLVAKQNVNVMLYSIYAGSVKNIMQVKYIKIIAQLYI